MAAFSFSAINAGAVPHGGLESSVTGRAKSISELDDMDAVVKAHRARLMRFVAYSTGDADLAETIVQDTFLRAWKGRESFRGDCSVSTWLTGIALNVVRDHQRSERFKFWRKVKTSAVDVHEMASFLPSGGTSVEGQLLARERVKEVASVLLTLSHNQRTIFLMKFSEEMAVTDISEVLGMPVATVRTNLHRALTAVRGKLGARI